jgi:TonB family protein
VNHRYPATFTALLFLAGCGSVPTKQAQSIPWVETDRPNCVVDVFFPAPNEKATWSGQCVDGRVAGHGKLVSSSGTRLEGEFRSGIAFDAEGRVSTPRNDGQRVLIGAKFTAGRGDFYHLPKQPAEYQAYAQSLAGTFRKFIVFSDRPTPAPVAVVEIAAEPDGKVKSYRLRESSGYTKWDEAVMRAVSKVPFLPSDVDGIVPARLIIDFRPY